MHYYPFGMLMEGLGSVSPANDYTYSGKELNDDFGLNLSDYGARWYDAAVGRWWGVDPLAGNYKAWSSYNYCINNPLIYIDPTGAYIEPASQKEWEKQTGNVRDRRDKLQGKIDKLTAKAAAKGWSAEKLAGKIGNMNDRVASLSTTLDVFGTLEKSTQGYSLKSGSVEVGGTSYDSNTGLIVIGFSNTANFVHEVTHAGQFESGEIAFGKIDGGSYVQDVEDEANSYKAQFAFDPSSVSGLMSSSRANSFEAITPAWVQGITTSTGDKLYAPGGSSNTAISPINVNSSKADLIRAYPHIPDLQRLPENYTVKSNPNILYKGQ